MRKSLKIQLQISPITCRLRNLNLKEQIKIMIIKFLVIFGTIFVITFHYYTTAAEEIWNKKDWKFVIVTSEIENKYEKNLKVYLDLTRISRGMYGATGNLTIKEDVIDDQTMVSLEFFRSERNDNNFKPLPYKFPKQKFFNFMNSHYKLFMRSFQNCSNLPVFEGKFDPKLVAKGSSYHLYNCFIGEDVKFPNHLEPGLYKSLMMVLREPLINLKLYFILDVTQKNFWQ